MDLTEARGRRDPRVNEDKKAPIKRLPSPLRLRVLLLLSSLLWLRHLRLLLLRRLHRPLPIQQIKLVEPLVRRVLQVAKGTKETLERTARTARRETPVLVAALVRRDTRALVDRADLLARLATQARRDLQIHFCKLSPARLVAYRLDI